MSSELFTSAKTTSPDKPSNNCCAGIRVFKLVIIVLTLLVAACAKPYVRPSPSITFTPILHKSHAVMNDGYRLPLTFWESPGKSQAILLALHGLNDYSNAFQSTGEYLSRRGITVIAYDQRGFGRSDGIGLWYGASRLTEDLHSLIALLHDRYPEQPLYLFGESMGGAVVLAAMNREPLDVDGIILLAPAVWSRSSMPLYQRFALWITAHTFPALKLTGEGLDLHPSDNIEMLRANGRDPLVIKETRVDVLYGVANLMDKAVASLSHLDNKMLILYGKHDDIIPREPTCQWLRSLPPKNGHLRNILIYEDGYHMLTRDLQADVVLEDMYDWLKNPRALRTQLNDTVGLETFCPETPKPDSQMSVD